MFEVTRTIVLHESELVALSFNSIKHSSKGHIFYVFSIKIKNCDDSYYFSLSNFDNALMFYDWFNQNDATKEVTLKHIETSKRNDYLISLINTNSESLLQLYKWSET